MEFTDFILQCVHIKMPVRSLQWFIEDQALINYSVFLTYYSILFLRFFAHCSFQATHYSLISAYYSHYSATVWPELKYD